MSTDILISFDTTGSMSPCIAEIRRKVEGTIDRLFDSIEELRIGIIAHGDYCDGPGFFSAIPLTTDREGLKHFVHVVHNTYGGDYPECYEYVLRQASMFDWQAENRAMILIRCHSSRGWLLTQWICFCRLAISGSKSGGTACFCLCCRGTG